MCKHIPKSDTFPALHMCNGLLATLTEMYGDVVIYRHVCGSRRSAGSGWRSCESRPVAFFTLQGRKPKVRGRADGQRGGQPLPESAGGSATGTSAAATAARQQQQQQQPAAELQLTPRNCSTGQFLTAIMHAPFTAAQTAAACQWVKGRMAVAGRLPSWFLKAAAAESWHQCWQHSPTVLSYVSDFWGMQLAAASAAGKSSSTAGTAERLHLAHLRRLLGLRQGAGGVAVPRAPYRIGK